MAKAIISSVLEAQLGKYVDGLSSDSLQVGLWSGELTLQRLALKPHALAELNLPVRVVRGAVERVHVVVPWNQLGSASVQVTIEGVTALVTPSETLPTAAERRQHKQNQIERLELVRQHDRFTARARFEGEDESTFLSRLTERIVDNLQVTLRNVHIRYEDAVSNPEHPFACGLMVESFRFHSTDAEGNDVFVDRSAGKEAFSHKAISITRVGAYWDRLPQDDSSLLLHTREDMTDAMNEMIGALQDALGESEERTHGQRLWVLRPLSLAVQLTKNETQDYSSVPKYAVQTKIESLACGISREQYEDIIFLNKAFLGRRVVEAHFANARRRPFHRATERPREWWDYAVRLALIRKRSARKESSPTLATESELQGITHAQPPLARLRFRWSSISRSLIELKLYMETFRTELRKQSPLEADSEQGRFKAKYEAIYPVDVIMSARDFAEEEELRDNERKKRESAKAAAAVAQQGGSSWYSYFFGGSTETNGGSTNEEDSLNEILTAEGRADLKEAYDQIVSKETSEGVPSGCNLFSLKLQLAQGSLGLFHAGERRPFASATLTGLLEVNVQPFEEWDARFRLQHFEILNASALGTPFHTFCTLSPSTSEADRRLPCMSLDASMKRTASSVTKTKKELDAMMLKVRLSCMPIRLMGDPLFVLSLHHFFVSLLPDEQLEKVWLFATSSVSEWIFSNDDDGDEVIRSIDTSRREIMYDVLVDVNAPVIVIPENAFEPAGAVLVIDFGKLSFANDKSGGEAVAERYDTETRQLLWRLDMRNVRVLLGERAQLTWTDAELQRFARLVEELSLELSVKTLQQASRIKYPTHGRSAMALPQVDIQANIPGVYVSLSEEQLVALGRIHSSVIAAGKQVAENSPMRYSVTTGSEADSSVQSVGDSSSSIAAHPVKGNTNSAVAGANKCVMRVQISLGEIVVNVRESAMKDAFVIRVLQISLDSNVFTSHYTIEAKLKSLVMHDKLYDETSAFYELISTGSSVDQDLISISVLGFTSTASSAIVKQLRAEASRSIVDIRCHILDVQWNPSSMALLCRIGSAYVSALKFYSEFDDFEDALEEAPEPGSPERVPERSTCASATPNTLQHGTRTEIVGQSRRDNEDEAVHLPAVLLRASLVQFSITFNKDQANRRLVRLAMKNAAVQISSHVNPAAQDVDEEQQTALRAVGHVGNFVVTDMSMAKHPVYSTLIGLDEREVLSEDTRSSAAEHTTQSLVEFAFASSPSTMEKSTLSLNFRPLRVVYFHQQVLELVDYLLEGIMGAMVNQTLANATQLLLSTEDSSVIVTASIVKPSLILPLSIEDANHLKVTADTLKLEHFPSSVIRYEGSGPAEQRKKTIFKHATPVGVARVGDPGCIRADYKEVVLVKARILCTCDPRTDSSAENEGGFVYTNVLEEPVDMIIGVEDLISVNVRLKDDATFLPRFTIESEIDQVKIGLSRTSYLSLIALVMENFGADEIANASAVKVPTTSDSSFRLFGGVDDEDGSLRPTVNYTYMDPNAELVTIRTLFSMRTVCCRLLNIDAACSTGAMAPDSTPSAVGSVVDKIFGATPSSDGAFTALTVDQLSFSSAQLRDHDPSIKVRMGALTVRDLAGEYLDFDKDDEGGNSTVPELLGQHGAVMLCEQPTEIVYSWNEDEHTGQLDLKLSQVTGVVIPEALMALGDFFTLPTKADHSSEAHTCRLEASAAHSAQHSLDHRRESGGMSSSSSNRGRRQSIAEILLDAHSPELALTVNVEAARVGIAVPVNCCDPSSPTISCVGDFSVVYSWKPGSPSGGDDEDDQATSDFDIQSSLVMDARRVEVVIANANRQGCCVPRQASDHSAGVDVAALIQIIEPCELHVKVSDLFPHARQKQQIVALRFSPIDVFVSHDDVCLAMETVEKLSESAARYTLKQSVVTEDTRTGEPIAGTAPQSAGGGILSPRAFQSSSSIGKDAAVALEVHRYFTLEVASVCLTLINDCDGSDMGLAQFQLERCNFFLNVTYDEAQSHGKAFAAPPETAISGGGSFVVLMSYYNPDTRDWHPMSTEWSMDLAVQGCVYLDTSVALEREGDDAGIRAGENELHVILTANHPLEITVTHGLLEVAASVGGAWRRRAAGLATAGSPPESPSAESGIPRAIREARENRKHAPCVIRNETGVDFEFWLTNGRANTARQVVRSGDIADLRYTHTLGRGSGVVRKYASAEREAANMRLCVQLGDTAFQPVQGIIFEQLGSRAFPLVDVSGHLSSFSLNCYAKLVDGRILLSVSSQVKVVNKLSMPVQLLVNDPTWKSPVEIGVLQPLKESAIPLLVSLGTELRVRPVTRENESPFSWSAPIPVQQRSEVSLKVEAAATGGGYGSSDIQSAVFAVSLSVEQSLRVVSLSEPIILVNKLPVSVSFAIKSVTMNGASVSGSKGETVDVGSKFGIWWSDPQQRPLFRLNIDGCQPSKWIELIHPRTKMGTVLSVMLERADGRPFKILMQVIEDQATKAVHLVLYAEVWFVNRTGLELIYGNDLDGEAYMPPFEARALVGNAQICAYSTFGDGGSGSSPPVVRVGMSSCQWSTRFVADPRRLSWQDEVVTMRGSANGRDTGAGMLYEFGVSADYATRHFGSITTLVSFFPRYLIMNHTPHTVLLYEDGQRGHGGGGDDNVAHHVLASGDTYALYWVTGTRSKVRVSVIGDREYEWSGAFSVDHVATSDILIPERAARWGNGGGSYQSAGVPLQVVVKRGSISQSTMVVVISESSPEEDSVRSSVTSATAASPAHPTWDRLSLHAQVAGVVVTIADKKEDDGDLFGATSSATLASGVESEEVARLSLSRIGVEASMTPEKTSAKVNLMGLKFEDLLPQSKNPVVLCPVSRGGDYRGSNNKYFLEMSYLERPHPKYQWIERFRVELQDVRVATSMRFVDRLNRLLKETVSHFENRSYSSFSQAASSMLQDRDEDTRILQYFVPTAAEDDSSMTSITGRKIYVEACEIAPVRVIVSFSRGKGDVRQPDPSAGFWLSNLKLKIENACLILDAFKLSRAMGTQQALADSLTSFYEKSVKSQALGLIDSIQVTSLVTSVVTGGVSSLVSTIMGKTDPSLAAASGFRYEQLSNGQIVSKHSRALEQCRSPTQLLEQAKHLVFDWDSNHTGLGARGCVVLALVNNSRHSLVINAQLRDGAELHVLPLGRRLLASVLDAPRSAATGQSEWRSDRAMLLFAFGYTPTPLTSGDVYFEVRSNACNVFVTRKTARLKANLGYTATFTHQESQPWWSTNVAIIGDDLHATAGSSSYAAGSSLRQTAPPITSDADADGGADGTLFGPPRAVGNDAVRRSSTMGDSAASDMRRLREMAAAPSAESDEEYEVTFSGQALGIIAKQSGRAVVVRECTRLPSGEPGPALATGRISPGDLILSVNGVTVANTTQFRELVRTGPRPLVLRLRASGARYSAAFNLFGEAPSAAPASTGGSGSDGGFDLFGVGR